MAFLEIDEITLYKEDRKFPILFEYNEIKNAYVYLTRYVDKQITLNELNKILDREYKFMEPSVYDAVDTLDSIVVSLGDVKKINNCLADKLYYYKNFSYYLSKKNRNHYLLDIQEVLNMLNYIKQNTTSILEYVLNNKGFNSNMFREYTTYLVNMVAKILEN